MTAASTPRRLDHRSFAVVRQLAPLGSASYPVLVHRPAISLHASFPRSVTHTQLRFASLAVVSSREDFHLQDRAHAGRTNKLGRADRRPSVAGVRPRPSDDGWRRTAGTVERGRAGVVATDETLARGEGEPSMGPTELVTASPP